jgi:hypothetical protein
MHAQRQGVCRQRSGTASRSRRAAATGIVERAAALNQEDLAARFGRVWLPERSIASSLLPRATGAGNGVFPAPARWKSETTEGRHHDRNERVARPDPRRPCDGHRKRASCYTFRHSFATHLLECGHASGPSRNSSGTARCRRPRSTPTFSATAREVFAARWIRHDECRGTTSPRGLDTRSQTERWRRCRYTCWAGRGTQRPTLFTPHPETRLSACRTKDILPE